MVNVLLGSFMSSMAGLGRGVVFIALITSGWNNGLRFSYISTLSDCGLVVLEHFPGWWASITIFWDALRSGLYVLFGLAMNWVQTPPICLQSHPHPPSTSLCHRPTTAPWEQSVQLVWSTAMDVSGIKHLKLSPSLQIQTQTPPVQDHPLIITAITLSFISFIACLTLLIVVTNVLLKHRSVRLYNFPE